jgi:hypothetical protein
MRSSKLTLSVYIPLSAALGVSAVSAADLAVKAPIAPAVTPAGPASMSAAMSDIAGVAPPAT